MNTNKEKLLEAAKKAKDNAYAPYSKFHVGAAILAGNGEIYHGCNVENTSYGLTICAERNAVCRMVADGTTKIDEIMIIGDTEEFLPPCGACRQVIAEFAHKDTIVYMSNKDGQVKETTVNELIPFVFFLDK
ncbi:MAG: cytidine deaminase [bacterium]|nr:cytidine deaminase [bacterium]